VRPTSYIIGFVRVLFGIGLWGLVALLIAAAFGIGWAFDYIPVRAAINPTYKAWVGADMPHTLPWLFIGAAFVLIALFRLVHRHVMWEAILPRLKFSEPQVVWTNLQWAEDRGPTPIIHSSMIAIGYVEISNKPRSIVGGLAAEGAWVTAKFTNLRTKKIKEVRFCRWTDNPKPRSDEHTTTLPVRYKWDWNLRTLAPNGVPNRLDFFIRHLSGDAYGFQASSQENAGWINENHRLWNDAPIQVDLFIEAGNLDPPAKHSFILDFSTPAGIEFRPIRTATWPLSRRATN